MGDGESEMTLNRPEPIDPATDVIPFTKRRNSAEAVDELAAGRFVLVRDFFSSGLLVLAELRKRVRQRCSGESYEAQRERRTVFRELSHRLLLRVRGNQLLVRKAPEIGWLRVFYRDTDEFLIPFVQAQGLNSAWQWYQKGIAIPVLNDRVFPYYGTYFPTRFEHLEIFDEWLKGFDGKKTSAIDVGVGSGVITYQLMNRGFTKVVATDSNPNAIHGMREAIAKRDLGGKVELLAGDLFAGNDQPADLIVFNPPWLPLASDREGLDLAMYYDDDLFPRFFAETLNQLRPEGRLVLLFSNLAQVTQLTKVHPIEKEVENGGRWQKELLVKSRVKAASNKTRRNQTWREDEQVELWVLKPRDGGVS